MRFFSDLFVRVNICTKFWKRVERNFMVKSLYGMNLWINSHKDTVLNQNVLPNCTQL